MPLAILCLVPLVFLSLESNAQARTAVFRAQVEEQARASEVSVLRHGGVAYISLTELVHELKGGCALLGNRAQVDLAGKSAWLRTGSTQVQSSLSDFSLREPTIAAGEEVLMALRDVEAFFEQAFAIGVTQAQTAQDNPNRRVSREALPPIPDGQEGNAPAQDGARSPASEAGQPGPPGDHTEEAASSPRTEAPEPAAKMAMQGAPEVIVIDPGHGGTDNGAVGVNGFTEKEMTLAIAKQLARELKEGLGAKVLLTRENDSDAGQDLRAKFANFNRGEVFLSLHAGASFSPVANGFELFHNAVPLLPSANQVEHARQAKELARHIDAGLRATTKAPSRGIRGAPCRILGKVGMPGLIIEVGCLTNPTEAELLASEEYHVKIAEGIARGMKQAYGQGAAAEGQQKPQ